MKSEDITLKSRHDDLELGVSLRIPEKPVGIVQIVHGMAEHKERYIPFMEYLAEQGYATIIHDHRGHGASVKSEADYGYFGQNGVQGIIDDAHQVTQYIREKYPELPLVLFGHSMGSLVVRSYMKQYDLSVDGLIVCGSPSKRIGSGLGLRIIRLMKAFKGERHRSKFVNRVAFGSYNKKFKDAVSPNSWIASDPAVVEAFDADPRDGFVFTLNGFEVLFSLLGRTYSKQDWRMQNPKAPIFFIAGEDDPCIISPKDFQKAVSFMQARGYQDVKSKLYPGMRHEILNEIGKEAVWQDVSNWVKTKILERGGLLAVEEIANSENDN